jgi:hypothetical protein
MDRTDQPHHHDQGPARPDRPEASSDAGRPDDARRPGPQPPRPNIRLTGTDQSEHDALAELFLGDAPFAPPPMDKQPREDAPAPGERDDPAPQPPAREPDRPRYDGSAVRAERPDSPAAADPATERPTVELVVLGHLPVRASLWVRQYACLSARKRSETVALVRAAAGAVSVDVITGRQAAEIEPVDSVEDAAAIATAAAARVVLRVDEIAEPEVLERDGVDEVTILTGADEAAVVASYRLIKTFAAQLDRLEPEAAPTLRVAVMGNPGPDIQDARARIAKACNSFLDRPIEILDASGRLDATGTVTVCRTDHPDATAGILDALLGPPARAAGERAPRTEPPAPDAAPPATLRFTGAPGPDRAPQQPPEIVVLPQAGRGGQATRPARRVAPPAPPVPQSTPAPAEERRPHRGSEPSRQPGPDASAPPDDQPLALRHHSPGQPGPDAAPAQTAPPHTAPAQNAPTPAHAVAELKPLRLRRPLADLLDGLSPLETRCPTAPGVELACDDRGRLHAIATDDRGAGDAVAALLTAAAWARANLALLIRAESRVAMPSPDPRDDADAALHLLARRPGAARAVLDTDVRVYALAAIPVGPDHVYVATPLNDE